MQIVKRTPFAWMSGSHGAGAKVNAEASEPELKAPLRHDGFYGEPLSEAELRVLVLLVGGRSVSEVARELYLAPTTVKTHRRTIYRKLGVTDRREAIARAAELGLTRLELANHPG